MAERRRANVGHVGQPDIDVIEQIDEISLGIILYAARAYWLGAHSWRCRRTPIAHLCSLAAHNSREARDGLRLAVIKKAEIVSGEIADRSPVFIAYHNRHKDDIDLCLESWRLRRQFIFRLRVFLRQRQPE